MPTRSPPSRPRSDGERDAEAPGRDLAPREAAAYIADLAGELAEMARIHELALVAELLRMASHEASESVRTGQGNRGRNVSGR